MFPLVFKSSLDWDLFGEEEPGLGGRRLYLPRGRVIGGSSSINAMIYLRGHRADFDGWAEQGCTGWSYDEVLPYFKRSEDNERGADEFHGVGGPLSVSDSRSMSPFIEAELEAAVEAGYDAHRGPERRPSRRASRASSSRSGTACAAARRTRSSIRSRTGRTSRSATGVFVERIVFEGDRAVGVELVRNGVARDGAGRARGDRLRRHVPVARAAHALRDRPGARISSSSGSPCARTCRSARTSRTTAWSTSTTSPTSPGLFGIFTPENFALLEAEGRGPLTSNYPEAGGFFTTRSGLPAPDVEFHFAAAPFFDQGLTPPPDNGFAFGPVDHQADVARQGGPAHADARVEADGARATSSPPPRIARACSRA